MLKPRHAKANPHFKQKSIKYKISLIFRETNLIEDNQVYNELIIIVCSLLCPVINKFVYYILFNLSSLTGSFINLKLLSIYV